jgi:hypothetical protein
MSESILLRVNASDEKAVAARFLVLAAKAQPRVPTVSIELHGPELSLAFADRDAVIMAVRSLEAAEGLGGGVAEGARALKKDLERIVEVDGRDRDYPSLP